MPGGGILGTTYLPLLGIQIYHETQDLREGNLGPVIRALPPSWFRPLDTLLTELIRDGGTGHSATAPGRWVLGVPDF
ncbi:hypothetical protein NDU88_003408 [Pleurodeles waltl]|uniref:Uncharacterized protein n=1 Tax=Pleurodeles waltl TaxID=8319 RepID=A0AAV7MQG6_PLEWA|nr:hypothetical protein NDU88_003408 [Pleurodeles waltl]